MLAEAGSLDERGFCTALRSAIFYRIVFHHVRGTLGPGRTVVLDLPFLRFYQDVIAVARLLETALLRRRRGGGHLNLFAKIAEEFAAVAG